MRPKLLGIPKFSIHMGVSLGLIGRSYQTNSLSRVSSCLVVVVNLYLTRVIPSEYLKVYLLSIGALNNKKIPTSCVRIIKR